MLVTLLFLGLVGGLITGISPCILPVLPVVFLSGGAQSARTAAPPVVDRVAAWRAATGRDRVLPAAPADDASVATAERAPGAARRPYLVIAGLVLSFSVFTLLGSLVLRALPVPQDVIRWVGLAVLVLIGVGMIVPPVERLLDRAFAWVPQRGATADRGAFVLGLTLGAVYVPCAGPVLAAITVAGATGRIGASTIVLTVAFAVGTAVPLLAFALAGRGVAERVRAFRRHQRGVRLVAGVVVLGLAVALACNATDAIQRAIPDYTTALNRSLTAGVGSTGGTSSSGGTPAGAGGSLAGCQAEAQSTGATDLTECGTAPALRGLADWMGTPHGAPLTLAGLHGKVVLIDFWAYSCINCQRAIAHVEAWYRAYAPDGFEVIGVHTPEYAFEHVPADVAAGAKRLGITYPVALDNDYATWNAYRNDSWPADYLIDASGHLRRIAIGEGGYGDFEASIRTLLTAAHPGVALPRATAVPDTTPTSRTQTPETYLDPQRASNYDGAVPFVAGTARFAYPSSLAGSAFALAGTWRVGSESITAVRDSGIELRYTARDVYLDVGGTGTLRVTGGGTVRTIAVSGAPNIRTLVHTAAEGSGTLRVTLSKGLSAYSFTFG